MLWAVGPFERVRFVHMQGYRSMNTRVGGLRDYKAVAMHHTVKALLREGAAALRPAQMLSSMQHCVVVGTIARSEARSCRQPYRGHKKSEG
jgi:hypothetical protein